MTTRSAAPPVGLCRCAECKIDLRGRFVFVDDETETLLGRPRVELFGQPITDVLDRSSQDVIDHILAVRNHYETHFDYAPLTLISKDGRQLPVDATISLCFNSGNPVNYQLILKPHSNQVRTIGDIETGLGADEFVERCLALEPTARYRQLAELLREFTAAEQVAIYLITGDHLEPRSGAAKDSDSPFVFDSMPAVNDLHQRVALADEEYAFTDTDDAGMALDTDGAAPPEYVTRVSVEEDVCLLRFIFDATMISDTQQQAVTRARLAKRLVRHLFIKRPDPSETDSRDINVQFTIGFLSSLGIGAFLTDAAGQIIGYNPALADMLGEVGLGETCHDFVSLLEQGENAGLAALLDRRLPDGSGEHRVEVTLPSGEHCLLVVMRLSDDVADHSACWVLMPKPAGKAGPTDNPERPDAMSRLIDDLKPTLDELTTTAEQLSSDHCQQVGKLDDIVLGRLHDTTRTLHQLLDANSLPLSSSSQESE